MGESLGDAPHGGEGGGSGNSGAGGGDEGGGSGASGGEGDWADAKNNIGIHCGGMPLRPDARGVGTREPGLAVVMPHVLPTESACTAATLMKARVRKLMAPRPAWRNEGRLRNPVLGAELKGGGRCTQCKGGAGAA